MHSNYQYAQYANRHQSPPQQGDASRQPYSPFPPPPPSATPGTSIPSGYSVPPPPPRRFNSQAPGPNIPPPPPGGPPGNIGPRWQQRPQPGYFVPPPPPLPGQPAPYNPHAYYNYQPHESSQPLTSSTFIPNGDSFGIGVGIPPLHPRTGQAYGTIGHAGVQQRGICRSDDQSASNLPDSLTITSGAGLKSPDPSQTGQANGQQAPETSATPVSATTKQFALEWPVDRVVEWLSTNHFSPVWQKAFRKLNLQGAEFLEIGKGHGGKGSFQMMHNYILPEVARKCTEGGITWEQGREVDEGRRLRKLVRDLRQETSASGRDSNQLPSANTDDSAPELLPFPDISDPNGSAFAPFASDSESKTFDSVSSYRTSSPTTNPLLRAKASDNFSKQVYHPTPTTEDDARSRWAMDDPPRSAPDDLNRIAHKANGSREVASPSLTAEQSPRTDSNPTNSRDSSTQRTSTLSQGRNTPSGSYPGLSRPPKQRYYGGHQRNQSSGETNPTVPRSATEVSRPWMDYSEQRMQGQETQRPASGEPGGRHQSTTDSIHGPKEHRNILMRVFNRSGKKDEHPSPDDTQAPSPSSPVNFRLPTYSGHNKTSSDGHAERAGHDTATPLASYPQDVARKFILVTPDGWNYRLVNVSGVETIFHFQQVLTRELSLPDPRDLSIYVTSPGQEEHEEPLSQHLLQEALQQADATASLKLFIKTPYNVALPTSAQSSFPANAKLDPFPGSLTNAPRDMDQATYDQSSAGDTVGSISPVDEQPTSADSYASREAMRAEANDLLEKGTSTYRPDAQRKGKKSRESRQFLLKESPVEGPWIRPSRKIDFDNRRQSPFDQSFPSETLEPRRKPPPVPPETSTLKIANSLSRKQLPEGLRNSLSDQSVSPPRKGPDDLAHDASVRGRRKAIADSPASAPGIAGALAGAAKVGMLPITSSSASNSRPTSSKSDGITKDSGKDSTRALASVNFNESVGGRNSPSGSPRSPGFTMSKGNVSFKIPEYEENKAPNSAPPQRQQRMTPEKLPNRILTDLQGKPHASPDVSPATRRSSVNKGGLMARHSTRRGPQLDFHEATVDFTRTPQMGSDASDNESDDGLFAVPILSPKEDEVEKPDSDEPRPASAAPRPDAQTLQSEPSGNDLTGLLPGAAGAPGLRSTVSAEDLDVTPKATPIEPRPITRRPRRSDAERAQMRRNRQSSFLEDDGWAPRPVPEALVERLDEFFPNVDLDLPMMEDDQDGNLVRRDGHNEIQSPPKQDPTHSASPPEEQTITYRPSNASDHQLGGMKSLAHHNIRKSGGLGRTKSIRDVVKGAYKPPPTAASRPPSINPRLATVKNNDMVRRRSTKMFGAKIVEQTKPRGSRLIQLETIPQESIVQDSIDVPQRQKTFKWVKGEMIGKGSFGKVYLGMNTTSGEILAVKQVEINPAGQDKDKIKEMVKSLDGEIDTMQHLDHVNIVQYLGCERKEYSISIFLEYISGGSIGSCLRKHGKFEQEVVASLTRQTLNGLKYLHDQGVLHRDLKADNILLDHDGTCKISDFGISKKTDNIYGNDATNNMQGSVFWMAPEVVGSKGEGYSAKVDIWSLGCVVLEMFSGKRPWSKEEVIGAIYKLGSLSLAPPIPEEVSSGISPVALSFMLDCFNVDPSDRPTADRLLRQPFCNVNPNFNFLDTELYAKIAPAMHR